MEDFFTGSWVTEDQSEAKMHSAGSLRKWTWTGALPSTEFKVSEKCEIVCPNMYAFGLQHTTLVTIHVLVPARSERDYQKSGELIAHPLAPI